MSAGEDIALFPLQTVLFPGGPLPLRIFEARYIDMIRTCMRAGSSFGVVLVRADGASDAPAATAAVGCSARITDFDPLPDGLLGITCLGGAKFQVHERRVQSDGLNIGSIEWLAAEPPLALPEQYQHLGKLLRKVLPQLGDLYASVPQDFADCAWVGYRLAEILPLSLADKQQFLELADPLARLARLNPLIRRA